MAVPVVEGDLEDLEEQLQGILLQDLEDTDTLISSLQQMFPNGDQQLIKQRAKDLVGRCGDQEAFILQLLQQENDALDPEPPKQVNVPDLAGLAEARAGALGEHVVVRSPVVPQPTGRGRPLPFIHIEPVPGPPYGALEQFIDEKRAYLESLFPSFSPDFIMETINEVTSSHLQQLETAFTTKIESLLNMSDEEKKNVPTYEEWEQRKRYNKEKRTASLLTVQELLDLYPDPETYFNCGNLTEEDDIYRNRFLELRAEVRRERRRREDQRHLWIQEARRTGSLKECPCCCTDDCLEFEMISCRNNHLFCKDCVLKGANIAIGEGNTVIKCLADCREEYTWVQLEKVLESNVLTKLIQKRQAEEITQAGVEGAVTCPFCPFVTIMESANKVLVCQNPDCLEVSCRLCRKQNHIPLRCEEVLKNDEDVHRKRIEEQLSTAVIRECYRCQTKYTKEEGCNKIVCSKLGCGAVMCYLCKREVQGYDHFTGQGVPVAAGRCPLWTNSILLHAREVATAAQQARTELEQLNVTLSEESDPTRGIPEPETIFM